jgi:hypothetical protein
MEFPRGPLAPVEDAPGFLDEVSGEAELHRLQVVRETREVAAGTVPGEIARLALRTRPRQQPYYVVVNVSRHTYSSAP